VAMSGSFAGLGSQFSGQAMNVFPTFEVHILKDPTANNAYNRQAPYMWWASHLGGRCLV
jgi:hypothetical protein